MVRPSDRNNPNWKAPLGDAMEDPLAEAALAATNASHVRQPSGAIYFRVADAADVLAYYRRTGASLLGIEAFDLDGEGIRPRLDMILDCGSGSDSGACFDMAANLIEMWKRDHPEVVVTIISGSI